MSTASRERFAEVVRSGPLDLGLAFALMGCEVDPDLDPAGTLTGLDRLAAGPDLERALAGFRGGPGDYDDLRSSLLHEVLSRRQGLPLLLAVVWLEVAHRRGLPARAVGVPGHVLVALGGEGRLVDPFAGGSPPGPRRAGPVEPLEGLELVARGLRNIAALGARRAGAATMLWAVELGLLLPHHDLALRHERGRLLVRLGRHREGAAELERYADSVEDVAPDLARARRREARSALARLN